MEENLLKLIKIGLGWKDYFRINHSIIFLTYFYPAILFSI